MAVTGKKRKHAARRYDDGLTKEKIRRKLQGTPSKRAKVSATDIMPKPLIPKGDEAAATIPPGALPVMDEPNFPRRQKQQQQSASGQKRPRLSADKTTQLEAAVMSGGNDEAPWLAYIGWLASQSQIPAARAVAERALSRFSWADDQAKLNIWLAYMNLELHFGKVELVTPPHTQGDNAIDRATGKDRASDPSRGSLLTRALAANDPQPVLLHVAEQFHRKSDAQACLLTIRLALKKCGENLAVWKAAVKYHIAFNSRDSLGALLQRAEKNLVVRECNLLKVALGKFEFDLGDPLRGWNVFESLVERAPKRTDFWTAFVQTAAARAARVGPDRVRGLFERVTDLPWLKARHGKVFYDHWLRFEKAQGGDAAKWEHVKSKMIKFVQSAEA